MKLRAPKQPPSLPYPRLEKTASALAASLRWRWREVLKRVAEEMAARREIQKTLSPLPPMPDEEMSALDRELALLFEGARDDLVESLSLAAAYGFAMARIPDATGFPSIEEDLIDELRNTPRFVDSQAMGFVKSYGFAAVKSKDSAQMSEFRFALLDALQRGDSPRSAASLVAQRMGEDAQGWQTIARTEMARALNLGFFDEADALGVSFVWIPEQPRNCERCASLLSARVFPLDALRSASNVGKKASQWVAALPMHPNCTCAPIPASASLVEAARALGDGEIPDVGIVVKNVPPPASRKG